MNINVNTRGMSQAARQLLTAALEPSGDSKGLIVRVEGHGGFSHIQAGDTHWKFGRGEGDEYW